MDGSRYYNINSIAWPSLKQRFWQARTWLAAVCLVIMLPAAGCGGGAPGGSGRSHPKAKPLDIAAIRFDDGDTFYLHGEPVRVLGIDTPETRSPGVGIMIDQPYGPAAAESTRVWMTRARTLEWVRDGRDTYGRQLAHVLLDGELLAVKLLNAGLAYENVSFFGDNGFPKLAQRILDASHGAPRPRFEEPYKWRKKNQKK